jgi:hypothetical protein
MDWESGLHRKLDQSNRRHSRRQYESGAGGHTLREANVPWYRPQSFGYGAEVAPIRRDSRNCVNNLTISPCDFDSTVQRNLGIERAGEDFPTRCSAPPRDYHRVIATAWIATAGMPRLELPSRLPAPRCR